MLYWLKSLSFLISASLFFVVMGSALPQSVHATEELNIIGWCDHADPEVYRPFEERFDVRVNQKAYDATFEAITIAENSLPGEWDVFNIDSAIAEYVVRTRPGMLAELNPEDFPWDDFAPGMRRPDLHYVDEKLYLVPDKFGWNTLAYNKGKVDPDDIKNFSVVWNEKYTGRVAIWDFYTQIIQNVGIGLGISPSEITKDDLPAIKEKLFEMKDIAAVIGDTVTVETALATGEADIIMGAGDWIGHLLAEHPQYSWTVPDEGGSYYLEGVGVFATSENIELATELVKYLVSPEGQARLATNSCFWGMPVNTKAALSDEEKAIMRWDEQPGYIARSHLTQYYDDEMDQLQLDLWGEFLNR